MARKIIYKNDGLTISSKTPEGYKFIGYDNGIFSEKDNDTITHLNSSSITSNYNNYNIKLDIRLFNGELQVKWFSDDDTFLDFNPKIMLFKKTRVTKKGHGRVIKFSHPSENNSNGDFYSGEQKYIIDGDTIKIFNRNSLFDLPNMNIWTTLDINFWDYFRPDFKKNSLLSTKEIIKLYDEFSLNPVDFLLQNDEYEIIGFNNTYIHNFKLKLSIDDLKNINKKQRIILDETPTIMVKAINNNNNKTIIKTIKY